MIFFLFSRFHRNGSISHFWIEILLFPILKHPIIAAPLFLRLHHAVHSELDDPLSSQSSQSSYHSRIPFPQYHKPDSSIMIFSVSQITSSVEQVTIASSGSVFSSYSQIVSICEVLVAEASPSMALSPQSILMT